MPCAPWAVSTRTGGIAPALYEDAEPSFQPVYGEARAALVRLTGRDG